MTNNINESSQYETAKLLASYLFSLSLFALAGSLVYFTVEIAAVSKHIPDILTGIDNTSEKIEPVIDEVGEIIALIPPILKEIEETRKLIPPILKQVEQTRKQIPSILKETAAIRKELPAILASADKASRAVVIISKEIEATRPLISEALIEVKTTRESIPPMMDEAYALIQEARIAGKEASEGAITGVFTGIIKAPFALIGGAGRAIAGVPDEYTDEYEESDFKLIEKASLRLLNKGLEGDSRKWKNPETGNRGAITLTRIYIEEGVFSDNTECRELNIDLFVDDKKIEETNPRLCKDGDGWEIIK